MKKCECCNLPETKCNCLGQHTETEKERNEEDAFCFIGSILSRINEKRSKKEQIIITDSERYSAIADYFKSWKKDKVIIE